MPVALITSTIKSDPGRLMTLSLAWDDSLASPFVGSLCPAAFVAAICVPMTAAALTAAPFRKERRSIPCLLMICLLMIVGHLWDTRVEVSRFYELVSTA